MIFGPNIRITPEFLYCLQPGGLKSAYRKRALETHPDRARALGQYERELQTRFRKVQEAYELLSVFLESNSRRIRTQPAGARPRRQRPAAAGQRTRRARARPDHFYRGALPRRSLRLGQFLYYSGRVSWRALIEAIVWQRRQRPRIGQIAVDYGILAPGDIARILSVKDLHERFGECALRIGCITRFEQSALLGRQKMLQQRIGEYFIGRRLLSARELERLICQQRHHNSRAVRSAIN
jgi:hypothetical protein